MQTLYEYELQDGVAGLKNRGASTNDISSIVTEFEAVVGTRMNCLSGEENVESLKALNAVRNLIAAMYARIGDGSKRKRSINNNKIVK